MHPIRKNRLKELVKHLHWSIQQFVLAAVSLAGYITAGVNFMTWQSTAINGGTLTQTGPFMINFLVALVIAVITSVLYLYRRKKAFNQFYGGGE